MSEKDDKNDQFEFSDAEFEIKRLQNEVLELETLLQKMKQVILDNDLAFEVEGLDEMTEEEYIVRKGIGHLKKLYENGTFGKDDTQQLDILIRNLRLIEGKNAEKPKGKKLKTKDVGKLFEIVKGK